MPSVDVAIPCYNYGRFLRECVGSVLVQGIADLRVIVIDNASTDNSVEVARRLAGEDSRVELICHETNLGPHASFNEAIDRARADYLLILCADDILPPGALRRAVELLERVPQAAFALGRHAEFTTGEIAPGRSTGDEVLDGYRFIERCCRSLDHVAAHALLVRTSIQKRVGHYRSELPYNDDLEMALRLARAGRVAQLGDPISIRRIHATNLSEAVWDDRLRTLQEREAVFKSFFSREGRDMPGAGRLHDVAKKRVAEAAFWSAASHLVRGRTGQASKLLRYAFELDAIAVLIPPFGHLLRTQGAFRRVATAVSQALVGR